MCVMAPPIHLAAWSMAMAAFCIIASERSERADLVVSRARFFAIYIYISRSLRALL